jgi:hypothetical protein
VRAHGAISPFPMRQFSVQWSNSHGKVVRRVEDGSVEPFRESALTRGGVQGGEPRFLGRRTNGRRNARFAFNTPRCRIAFHKPLRSRFSSSRRASPDAGSSRKDGQSRAFVRQSQPPEKPLRRPAYAAKLARNPSACSFTISCSMRTGAPRHAR